MFSASALHNLRAERGLDHMKPKMVAITLHLFGREIFSLSFKWIRRNPWKGYELATPLSTGILFVNRKTVSIYFLLLVMQGLRVSNDEGKEGKIRRTAIEGTPHQACPAQENKGQEASHSYAYTFAVSLL